MEDAEVSVDDDDVEAGSRSSVKVAAPKQPTDKEIEEHEPTLAVSELVQEMRARSRDAGPALSGEEGRPPNEGVPHGLHVLGTKGCRGTDDGVHGSPRNGDENDDGGGTVQDDWHVHIGADRGLFALDRVSARRHSIVRSDQEPAIMSTIKEVGKIRDPRGGVRFVVQNSPVGTSQSNGVVERAIQSEC